MTNSTASPAHLARKPAHRFAASACYANGTGAGTVTKAGTAARVGTDTSAGTAARVGTDTSAGTDADSNKLIAALNQELVRDLGCDELGQIAKESLVGGARVRSLLALDLTRINALNPADTLAAACCAELLHNASLVHDDLQDRTRLRRGRPTVVMAYGADAALCTGDLLVSAAFAALSRLPARVLADALRLTHQAVARSCQGQLEDTAGSALDLNAYRSIAERKSAPLIALPVQLIALLCHQRSAIELIAQIADQLALGYQILDDLGDTAEDQQLSRPNYVNLLQAQGLSASASQTAARAQIQSALDQAEHMSVRLPKSLSLSLSSLSARLCLALDHSAQTP